MKNKRIRICLWQLNANKRPAHAIVFGDTVLPPLYNLLRI